MLLLPKVINLETGTYNWIGPSKICWKRSLDPDIYRDDQKNNLFERGTSEFYFSEILERLPAEFYPGLDFLVLFDQEKRTYRVRKVKDMLSHWK